MITIPDKFIDKCVAEFDADMQLDILQEECAELIQAIFKMKRRGSEKMTFGVLEEMTHVLISIGVVSRLGGVSQRDIDREVLKKCKKYGWNEDELSTPSPTVQEAVAKASEVMDRLRILLDAERERTKYEC